MGFQCAIRPRDRCLFDHRHSKWCRCSKFGNRYFIRCCCSCYYQGSNPVPFATQANALNTVLPCILGLPSLSSKTPSQWSNNKNTYSREVSDHVLGIFKPVKTQIGMCVFQYERNHICIMESQVPTELREKPSKAQIKLHGCADWSEPSLQQIFALIVITILAEIIDGSKCCHASQRIRQSLRFQIDPRAMFMFWIWTKDCFSMKRQICLF